MSKVSYAEKLRHPNWQRKRLEILERDDFQCQECESGDKPLHVHHGYYERGFDPWDYDNSTLETLCEECHKEAERKKNELYRNLARLPSHEFDTVQGYVKGCLILEAEDEPNPRSVKSITLENAEELFGFCQALPFVDRSINEYDVLNFIQNETEKHKGVVSVTPDLVTKIRRKFGSNRSKQ